MMDFGKITLDIFDDYLQTHSDFFNLNDTNNRRPADRSVSYATSGEYSPLSSPGSFRHEAESTNVRIDGGCEDKAVSKKFTRTSYTPEQLEMLSKEFQKNKYPDASALEDMSTALGVPAKKIKIWFQNRRARSKLEKQNHLKKCTKERVSKMPVSSVISPTTSLFSHFSSYYNVPTVPQVTPMHDTPAATKLKTSTSSSQQTSSPELPATAIPALDSAQLAQFYQTLSQYYRPQMYQPTSFGQYPTYEYPNRIY